MAVDPQVDICNRSLIALGSRAIITSLAQDSNEAKTFNAMFGPLRDELLRLAPWNCAVCADPLSLISAGMGTPENPFNPAAVQWNKALPMPPWAYEYAYPVACLRALYIIPQFATGLAGGVPITTAITGGMPQYWNGPPVRFKETINQVITAVPPGTIVTPGTHYAVNDQITLAGGQGFGGGTLPGGPFPPVPTVIQVTSVDGNGAVLGYAFVVGGSYAVAPTSPIGQQSTTGIGTGLTLNLTYTQFVDTKVILTNQEFAILTYIRRVTDVTQWDSQLTEAMVAALAARVAFAIGNVEPQERMQRANLLLTEANNRITAARVSDGNEGLTINDVTPDWIRIRGIDYPTDFGWTPNLSVDWGPTLTLY